MRCPYISLESDESRDRFPYFGDFKEIDLDLSPYNYQLSAIVESVLSTRTI
jgi:hypothetical protein